MALFGESAIEEFKESWVLESRRLQNLHMPMNLAGAAQQVSRIVHGGSAGNAEVDAGFLQTDREHQALVAAIEAVSQLFPFGRLNRIRKDLADDLAGGQGQQLSLRAEGRQKALERFGIEECSHEEPP